jgi:hypothetical protein
MIASPSASPPSTTAVVPPRVLLYRRVSMAEQARDGLSLATQQSETRRYAAQQGWPIGGEFADVLSGTRTDRPGLSGPAGGGAAPERAEPTCAGRRQPAGPLRALGILAGAI